MAGKVTSTLYAAAQVVSKIIEQDNQRLQSGCEEQCNKALQAKTAQAFSDCMRLCEVHKSLEQTPK